MKLKLPENINDKVFMSKKAGSFSSTPQSTVQAWTDKGYIISKTSGTGDRRKYSTIDCIEVGVIKKMSDDRIPAKTIAKVMKKLRDKTQDFLAYDYVYIIVREGKLNIPNVTIMPLVTIDGRVKTDQKTLENWYANTAQTAFERVLIYDLTKIAARVLKEISVKG